jgi:flagellar motor switch protein FliN/FliY
MRRVPPSTASSEILAALEDAEVDVAIEIARTSIALGELARLEPGDVLATRASLSSHVTLRVGDTLVARGELVDVDGQFAVRILEAATHPKAAG